MCPNCVQTVSDLCECCSDSVKTVSGQCSDNVWAVSMHVRAVLRLCESGVCLHYMLHALTSLKAAGSLSSPFGGCGRQEAGRGRS